MGQMNVVPYIDVMLVLLIIFMITAPLLQEGITVDLPDVDAETLDPAMLQNNEQLVVSIDAAGSAYLNLGESPDDPVDDETIARTAEAVVRRNPDTPVLLNADSDARHGRVITVHVLLQRAGATQIHVLTEPVGTEGA